MKVRAKIAAFDMRTWWGEAVYDLTVVEFHGTSVHGMRQGVNPVGYDCELLFNDNGKLYDVRLLGNKS